MRSPLDTRPPSTLPVARSAGRAASTDDRAAGYRRASGGHAGPAIGRRRPPSDGASIRCVLSEDRGCGEDQAQRQSGCEDEGMCTHGSITYSNSSARAGVPKRPENAARSNVKLRGAAPVSPASGLAKGQCDTGAVIHATTILAVRHGGRTVLAGDGQVTFGNTVLKHGRAEDPPPLQGQRPGRLRRLGRRFVRAVLAFRSEAGTVPRQPGARGGRAGARLADRSALRRLEAMLIVADAGARSCCRAPAI